MVVYKVKLRKMDFNLFSVFFPCVLVVNKAMEKQRKQRKIKYCLLLW